MGSQIHELAVRSLLAGDSPRLDGENDQHIEMLASVDEPLPPILVQRGTLRVVDGMHRLRATMVKGRATIAVQFFDGTEDEAFVRAVTENTKHGLPLTMADRRAATAKILASHPQRSDRWIAAITGVASGTVASIRSQITSKGQEAATRIGQDGRARPLNSAEGRRIASNAIREHPNASLREIAKIAGISPATVRDVRRRMLDREDPVPGKPRSSRKPAPVGQLPSAQNRQAAVSQVGRRSCQSLLQTLQKDPSLRFSDSGRTLLRWLDRAATGPGRWEEIVSAAPPHCVYLVAEMARSCADEWVRMAEHLERRIRLEA
jgi:hypothetical protein